MNAEIFIDSNVFVYAHDREAGQRHIRAKDLIESLWQERRMPWLSVQVLQEVHVNLVKKGIAVEHSARIVSRYLSWRVVDNTRQLFQQALGVQQRWKLSFWDSMIVAAAQRANVPELWSEDLNEGQDYGGVRVVNPLK